MREISIVRQNLVDDEYYRPYCGSQKKCSWPRTVRTWTGFKCLECGWESLMPIEFMDRYNKKWPYTPQRIL